MSVLHLENWRRDGARRKLAMLYSSLPKKCRFDSGENLKNEADSRLSYFLIFLGNLLLIFSQFFSEFHSQFDHVYLKCTIELFIDSLQNELGAWRTRRISAVLVFREIRDWSSGITWISRVERKFKLTCWCLKIGIRDRIFRKLCIKTRFSWNY